MNVRTAQSRLWVAIGLVFGMTSPVQAGGEMGAEGAPLPAGAFWTGFDTCRGECPPPAAALVLALEATAEAARAHIAGLPVASLPLGYPLLVHTDELGMAGRERGILIVLGVFADPAWAEAWRTTLPEPLQASRVIALSGAPVPWSDENGTAGALLTVVQLQSGPPVPAYPAAAVQGALDRADYDASADRILADNGITSLCALPVSSVFLVPYGDLNGGYYRFAPVRCGAEPAFVRWEDTLLNTLIWTDPTGNGHLRQVTGAECDSPFMTEWQYSPNGRGAIIEDQRGGGGCGSY